MERKRHTEPQLGVSEIRRLKQLEDENRRLLLLLVSA